MTSQNNQGFTHGKIQEKSMRHEMTQVADGLVRLMEKQGEWETEPCNFVDDAQKKNDHTPLNLARVLGVARDEAYSMAEIAWNLMNHGALADARAVIEGLVVLNPQDPYFLRLLGDLARRERNLTMALECYEQALSVSPEDIATRVEKGEVLLHMGRFEEALTELESVLVSEHVQDEQVGKRASTLVHAVTIALHKEWEKRGSKS